MEASFKSCNIGWVWSDMSGDAPEITKFQYLGKGLSYFIYLLHEVAHSWKLVLSWSFSQKSIITSQSCPK